MKFTSKTVLSSLYLLALGNI